VEVHYDKGLAIHIGPEPCAGAREGVGEASAGECIGQPLSRARTGGEARWWRQRDDGSDHDASSLSDVASGRPSKAASFFGWR
jgi:hypothetical protein